MFFALYSIEFFTRWLLVFEILIEIAGDHAVVELAHLIGLFAVEALEALVRGDDIHLPGGEGAEVAPDVAVEPFNLLVGYAFGDFY